MRTCITILGMAILAGSAAAIDFGAAWEALWEKSPAEAQPSRETVQSPAEPHMGAGVYRATGRGAVPPDAKSEAQGRLLAVGAAQLDALHKLATLLEGTDIAAESKAEQYVQTGYTVEETARAHLKGVRVLETRFAEDGIAEVDVELILAKAGQEPDFSSLDGYRIREGVTVVTTVPQAAEPLDEPVLVPEIVEEQPPVDPEDDVSQGELYQKSLETLFDVWSSTLSGVSEGIAQQNAAADAQATHETPLQEHQVAMAEPQPGAGAEEDMTSREVIVGTPTVEEPIDDGTYTDLVIDARGYGLIPSTAPRAITPKGELIFPFAGGILEKFRPEKEPEVRYLRSIEEAAALPGYGGSPLTIKADGVRLPDRTDVVIDKMKLRGLLALRSSRVAKGDGYVILLID